MHRAARFGQPVCVPVARRAGRVAPSRERVARCAEQPAQRLLQVRPPRGATTRPSALAGRALCRVSQAAVPAKLAVLSARPARMFSRLSGTERRPGGRATRSSRRTGEPAERVSSSRGPARASRGGARLPRGVVYSSRRPAPSPRRRADRLARAARSPHLCAAVSTTYTVVSATYTVVSATCTAIAHRHATPLANDATRPATPPGQAAEHARRPRHPATPHHIPGIRLAGDPTMTLP
jgi:hypothetical protein